MQEVISAEFFTVSWFVGVILVMEIGRWAGIRRLANDAQSGRAGIGATEGAVFGIFGLLVAFTFSGGASRFDARRQLIAQEANDVGTAWLRLSLLPSNAQPQLRSLFRQYMDSRLATYSQFKDSKGDEAVLAEMARSEQLQDEIWEQAISASRQSGADPDAAKLLLPALNAMIDITTTRTMALRIHPPLILYVFLFVVGMAAALLAGHAMAEGKTRSWVHILAFTCVTSICMFVIVSMEYPRMGLIRVDEYDHVLYELRDKMN